ncbi:uncharacterized protein [Eucyclogobius newberryi]|uniref:uncharacterized protein n=1 Tax=Eucyclogobius newberryi TaxID=166745 RepID=UPI003B5AC69A
MERRLEDMLSRIAMETQEIKELEQQLTDGQILANEALRKNLEGIIFGLQQYFKSLRAQAQSEDDKRSETHPGIDPTRIKSGSKSRSKPRTKTRRDVQSCLKDPSSMSVGSGATQDSGLDLPLISSPKKGPPTGARGNCIYTPMMKEQHHHHHHHTETNQSDEDSDSLRCYTALGPAEGDHRQRDRLRLETEKLRKTLRKHRRVLGVCEEVWCVEQTLMKRRAELRQAQRLLQEAHSSTAQAQYEAEEWQRRAKDSATCLQQTQLQLKELKDEVEILKKSSCVQILNSSPDLDPVLSRCLDSSDKLTSLRNQEERLQQRTEALRDQETRLKTTLQSLVEQQEALFSQRSSLVSATAEEEQGLERLRSELDSTRTELMQVLEEVLSRQQELANLRTLQSKALKKLQKTQLWLDQTRTKLDQAQDLLDRTKDQADQIKTEMKQAKAQLNQTESERLMKLEVLRGKEEEEVMEKQREADRPQAEMDNKRAELTALQQEVEMRQEEAKSCLKETERHTRELQVVKEKVEQSKEQNCSLQQQCRHLEDRRRHAHRCLSAVLQKLKQEQSQSLLTQQEATANQKKLDESTELLSLLGGKVEERKVQLQTLEQEVSALSEKHKQKQAELQEVEHRAHTQASAAVTESEDRGRRVTQEQLHKLSEELWQREQQLLEREAEFRHKEEGLHLKEEELPSERDVNEEEFYLSTAGLRSASSSEEERWRVEAETDELELKQDSLRARLHCSLRSQDQSLQERDLETEQNLRGLRHRVDQLDSTAQD